MLCPNCGTEVGDEVKLCDKCESEREARRRASDLGGFGRAPGDGSGADKLTGEAIVEEMLPGEAFTTESERWAALIKDDKYAPFLSRVTAAIIDLGVVNLTLSLLWLVFALKVATPAEQTQHAVATGLFGFLFTTIQFLLLLLGAAFPYFILFEMSPLAATPGKLLLGLVVTNTDGGRVSFRVALLRHAARSVSIVTLGLGYLLAAITPRRQAVHDGLARTLVLEGRPVDRLKVVGTFVFALCFSIGTVLLFRTASETAEEITTIKATPTPTPPKQLAQVGEKELRLPFSVAILRPDARQVEIGFFRAMPNGFDAELVRRQDTLMDIGGVVPDLQVVVNYKDNASLCSPFGVESYDFTFIKSESGFPLLEEKTVFSETVRPGEDTEGNKAMSLISIGCRPVDGGDLDASFKGFREIASGDEALRFSWELGSTTKLIVPQPIEKVEIDSDMARASVALIDKAASNLQIGYFAADLTLEDRELMRTQRSLEALPDNRPIVVISFSLSKGIIELATEDVSGYRVSIYRADAIRFPGAEEAVRFEYAGAPRVLDLGGSVRDGQRIVGTVMGRGIKRFESEARQFIWELDFDTELLDVDVDPKQPSENSAPPYLGRVTAGEVPVELVDAVAMIYPETNDLVVGFYTQPLSAEEIEECKKRKTVASTMNRRHAALIVLFDFKRESVDQLSVSDMLGYTVYFRRDAQGGLSFPGQHDSVSLKRMFEAEGKQELRVVRGKLKTGEKILLEMVARSRPTGSLTEFKWELRGEVRILDSVGGDSANAVTP